MLIKKTFQAIVSTFPLFNFGVIFSLGLATTNPAPLLASNLESLQIRQQKPTADSKMAVNFAQAARSHSPLSDGTYLYGQSSKPEQLGQEYLVFAISQGRVIGAFYMPQSEFSCFYGSLDSKQMDLSIVDPYENTTYPYSIALQELSPLAAGGQPTRSVGLEGYHQIDTMSDNDQRILNVCLDEYQ